MHTPTLSGLTNPIMPPFIHLLLKGTKTQRGERDEIQMVEGRGEEINMEDWRGAADVKWELEEKWEIRVRRDERKCFQRL